jgi:hypothetical protein
MKLPLQAQSTFILRVFECPLNSSSEEIRAGTTDHTFSL